MRREFDHFWNARSQRLACFFRALGLHGVTKEMIFGTVNRVWRTCSKIPVNPKPAGPEQCRRANPQHQIERIPNYLLPSPKPVDVETPPGFESTPPGMFEKNKDLRRFLMSFSTAQPLATTTPHITQFTRSTLRRSSLSWRLTNPGLRPFAATLYYHEVRQLTSAR